MPAESGGGPFRVTVVCTANRFRSPIGAACIAHALRGLPVEVDSVAAAGPAGQPAVSDVVRRMGERGLDLTAHRSRAVAPGLLADRDLVLCFEAQHAARAVGEAGAAREATFLLRELLDLLPPARGDAPRPPDEMRALLARLAAYRPGDTFDRRYQYPDPMAGPRRAFPAAVDEIADLTERVARRLAGLAEPPPTPAPSRRGLLGRFAGRRARLDQRGVHDDGGPI